MNKKQSRREFIKNSLTAGTGFAVGCTILSGCAKQNAKNNIPPNTTADEYSHLAYCCIDCNRCDLLVATRSNDDELKAKVAETWGIDKQEDFKLKDFKCFGCKSGKPGHSDEGCPVKKCAIDKKLQNCAYCNDFESCKMDIWKELPWLHQKVARIRKNLFS